MPAAGAGHPGGDAAGAGGWGRTGGRDPRLRSAAAHLRFGSDADAERERRERKKRGHVSNERENVGGGLADMPHPRIVHGDRGDHGPPPRRCRVLKKGDYHCTNLGCIASKTIRPAKRSC